MSTSSRRAAAGAGALLCLVGLVAGAPAGAAGPPALESHATPADGVFRMTGSGWGHGRGMSQWGAHQAAAEGRTHAEILAFYYPGTVLADLPTGRVRVLLTADTGRTLVVRAVPGLTATPAGGQAVTLPAIPAGCSAPATRWRARAVGTRVILAAYCGRWRRVERSVGPTVTFAVPDGLVDTQNGQDRRGYRGTVSATWVGRRSLRVVNTVRMQDYLRPVVAAEVSHSWPREALMAQAIAARSYAATEARGKSAQPFDLYDGVRSQVYPGAVWYDSAWRVLRAREHARTDAAVADTAGIHVTAAGVPVLTQFSSSNGGATAASPLPHMVVASDEWDARANANPRLAWTDTVSAASLRRACSRAGQVSALEVLAREGAGPWGGRLSALRIVGASGSCTLSTDTAIRAALGTNSAMVGFTG